MTRLAAVAIVLAVVAPAPAAASWCRWGACYSHASIAASTDSGAQARLDVERPDLGETGIHSLVELSVRVDRTDIVEVGWIVSPRLNGDTAPRLFVFRWIDGEPTCYNACGFDLIPGGVYPGMPLEVGERIRVRVDRLPDRWAVSLNGAEFGSYPNPAAGPLVAQAFGEVAYSEPGRVEMGDGTGQSRLLLRASGRCLRPASTDPRYAAVRVGRCSMRFGGA